MERPRSSHWLALSAPPMVSTKDQAGQSFKTSEVSSMTSTHWLHRSARSRIATHLVPYEDIIARTPHYRSHPARQLCQLIRELQPQVVTCSCLYRCRQSWTELAKAINATAPSIPEAQKTKPSWFTSPLITSLMDAKATLSGNWLD